eukprot:scaffold1663_cov171-Amphora_coffeaeformis.AAC.3
MPCQITAAACCVFAWKKQLLLCVIVVHFWKISSSITVASCWVACQQTARKRQSCGALIIHENFKQRVR